MLLTKKNRLSVSKQEYKYLKYLSHATKNLYNVTLYNTRQYFFENHKYLNYFNNQKEIKFHKDYISLPSDLAQQTMMLVNQNFSSFFALLKMKNTGKYDKPIFIPGYLEKDSFFILRFPVRKGHNLKDFTIKVNKKLQDEFKIKKIRIPRPDYISGKTLKQVRILPKCDAKYFEIEWVYEEEERIIQEVDKDRTISIDPGVNNFATIVDNKSGHPIILDGKQLKSYNRFFNKECGKKKPGSMNKKRMLYKRDRIMSNALNQYVNFILQYCILHKVGNIVMGEGYLSQNECNIGKKNNQNFVNIPYGKFITKLKCKCKLYGITFSTQEESYTSKCDHLANEEMKHHEDYLGKRIKRGLFKSSTGHLLNADVNGALGILIKSKHKIDLHQLVSSGRLKRPRRITLEDILKYSSIQLVINFCFLLTKPLGLPCGI